jgi:hypothetical protein
VDALYQLLRDNPTVVVIVGLIGLLAGLFTIYEFIRYQFGWKHGIINHWRLRSGQSTQTTVEPARLQAAPPPTPASITPQIADLVHQERSQVGDKEFADYIKRSLVHRYDGYGEKARYDYFFERMNAAPVGDLHRVTFLALADRRDFIGLAEGLKTWCKIGFDTIVHKSPEHNSPVTMNRLYTALLKELQGTDLHATGSREFAYAWAELVREYRADGN